MKEQIEKFLRYLEVENDASKHTLRAYRRDLESFSEFVGDKSGEIEMIDVRGFVARQTRDGLQKSTAARRLASVRSFLNFLCREGYMKSNPAKLVATPKSEDRLPNFLSVDDVFALVEKPAGSDILSARDKAILELLYSSGLRVAEIAGLNTEDVNRTEGLVKVRGKGKKERIVPIGSKALAALASYREEMRQAGYTMAPAPLPTGQAGSPSGGEGCTISPPLRGGDEGEGGVCGFTNDRTRKNGAMFLNRSGDRLSERGIRRIVVKYSRQIGIMGQIGPHTLRHTFASHLLQSGADLRVIQELLGHSSLSTTQKYTHIDMAHLMEVYDKAHPLSDEGNEKK